MQHTYISSEHFQLGRRRNHARPGQRKFPCPRQESNSRPSGSVAGTSDKHCGIRMVVSSILAQGTKIFVVPGEYDFSSFQVENVHWKCMCATHLCIIKINKNNNKINLHNHEFVRKKQNGGWKLSDTDWFYVSFYNPSCYFLWSELIRVQFYFFYFFIRSELVRVDPNWSDPDWRSELIRSDFCTFCTQ